VLAGIDFAADRGLQYIELDAGWYGPEMDTSSDATTVDKKKDLNIPAICSYARSKGLGVWLYVNQRALATQLDSILPRFRQWGVSGIKFGFVQVGNQKWTTWLHEAVRRCAQYHLMVDIHDEYRPTGFSRTYPNLMSQEGVGGNEEMPDARHNVTLPFTRFLAGPADYTPCYFSSRIKTTHGHQLAMSIVYYSPIEFLFWYDAPSDYHGEKELELWKQIPTVWDETYPICGEIGQYIALARRTDKTWYLGIMNGLETKTLRIPTAFLKKGHRYMATFYEDDPSHTTRTAVNTHTAIVRGGRSLTFKLLASGGASAVFSEIEK
jgi:alpha-glucosidase